ncbi:MAG: hypothetical protein OXT64_12165 [Gammaproteobacteria bacterium]|nr:hypothetical protein [Gammaproteobacteria bacterium]
MFAVGGLTLFLALPVSCELRPKGESPTFEEMELCTKIGAQWLSTNGRADAEDWFYIKRCSIDVPDGKPAGVRIHVVSSLALQDVRGADPHKACLGMDDLRAAVRSVMDAPVSIRLKLSDSTSTCARTEVPALVRIHPGDAP